MLLTLLLVTLSIVVLMRQQLNEDDRKAMLKMVFFFAVLAFTSAMRLTYSAMAFPQKQVEFFCFLCQFSFPTPFQVANA